MSTDIGSAGFTSAIARSAKEDSRPLVQVSLPCSKGVNNIRPQLMPFLAPHPHSPLSCINTRRWNMGVTMRHLNVWYVISLLLLLTTAATADTNPNLLTNPAFTDPAGKGVPDGWQALPGGNGHSTWLSVVKDEDGGGAVKIIDHDGSVGVGVSQRAAGQAGRQYAFSAETQGGSICLYLRFYDEEHHREL